MIEKSGRVELSGSSAAVLVAYGVCAGWLLLSGGWDYPNLHIVLDTAPFLLSGLLAWLFWSLGLRGGGFPLRVAMAFAVTSFLEAVHVLVTVEWSGVLTFISDAAHALRPATWGPSAYALPLGLIWVTVSLRADAQSGLRDALSLGAALSVLSASFVLLFQFLPAYSVPNGLGISRPTLLPVPFLWGLAGWLCWRRRAADRALPATALMAGVLLSAQVAMLYSRAPNDTQAMVAHVGKVCGYLIILLTLFKMSSADMLNRLRAETELAHMNQDLESRVLDRTAKLEASEGRLQAIINASPVPQMLTDADQRVISLNPAFVEAFGYGLGDLQTTDEWWIRACPDPEYRDVIIGGWEVALQGALREGLIAEPMELKVQGKGGALKTVLVSSALVDHSARGAWLMILYDITERKRWEEKLRESEALLRIAGQTARLGGWTIDVPDGRVTWSDEVCMIREVPMGTVPTLEEAVGFYTPESREQVKAAMDACVRTGASFDLECEGVTGKGNRMWVRSLGQAERDQTGMVRRLRGAIQDITARKDAEIELFRTNRALKMLSSCNEALIRAEEEESLLQSVCQIAVDVGGYQMCRIYFAADEEVTSIVLKASAGDLPLFVREMPSTWSADRPGGLGPLGDTIRSGDLRVVHDLTEEIALRPYSRQLREAGLRVGIYLPVKTVNRTLGVLALYPRDSAEAGEDELRLLRELADDLALGIVIIRSRVERAQADLALVASLREKEALLKEVHHRVKNNMQVITSLLRLESNRIDHVTTRSVLKDMQNRIQSMAVLHEALYRSGNFARVDLAAYLGQLTKELTRSLLTANVVFHVDLVTVGLDIDQAIPCGLILNELVSNALKHAFPGGRPGQVWVHLRSDASGELRLGVRDDGVGFPKDFESRRSGSLGLQLVSDLARQVRGRLETSAGPGAAFEVIFTPESHREPV